MYLWDTESLTLDVRKIRSEVSSVEAFFLKNLSSPILPSVTDATAFATASLTAVEWYGLR